MAEVLLRLRPRRVMAAAGSDATGRTALPKSGGQPRSFAAASSPSQRAAPVGMGGDEPLLLRQRRRGLEALVLAEDNKYPIADEMNGILVWRWHLIVEMLMDETSVA
ncbi:unnamed protein product [Miscanthus lutarioriparius]|uniref:Uncharacterized protein n=1 Tax=Miscanthus lutarioriparius TaxID=422564 RepID=A0A811MXR8_9POAL|nr:unnamed protein product [Miscanthus lutarioriparius]